jgi:SEL1 protein
MWESVKQLFVGPVLEEGDAAEEEYEDYSGAGWVQGEEGREARGGGDGGALDAFDDDLIETLVILGLTGLIMGLVWLRGRWARQGVAIPQRQ